MTRKDLALGTDRDTLVPRVDLGAKCLSVQDKFDGMVPFLLIQEFIEGLLGKDIFELLVRLRYYIL